VAEPGRICLSADVHDQIEEKLPLAFDDRSRPELST
jgi:hypothetical protein